MDKLATTMADDELIRHLLANPDQVALTLEVRRPGFFDAFIWHVKTVTNSTPAEALPMLDIGLRIVTSTCQSVQTWGLRAAAHRSLDAPERALAMISTAFLVAGDCRRCRADLLRRRGKIYACLGDRVSAMSDANASVDLYGSLGHEHHDLDGNGLAKALVDRADIQHYFGSQTRDRELLSASIADITTALDLTVPTVSPVLFRTALLNLSVALYSTGRRSDLVLAEEHLRKARNLFRGPTKASQERGKVAWATGMVRHELGGFQPCRIRQMLEFSRSDFLAIGLIPEACAVASDLAKIDFPNRSRIRAAMTETSQGVSDRIDAEDRKQFEPLIARMEQIGETTHRKGLGVFEDLRQSIEELREACGPKMLACLVSWPAL